MIRVLFCKSASGKKCQRNYPTKKQTTKSTTGNLNLQKAKNDCKRNANAKAKELQNKERSKQESNVFCFSGFVCLLIAGFLRLPFFACLGWTSFRFAFSDLFFLFLFAFCSPGIINFHLARRTLSEVLLKNSRTSEVRLANHTWVGKTWPTNYFDLPYTYCIGQTQKKSGTAMISSGPAVSVKFLLANSGQIKRRLGLSIGIAIASTDTLRNMKPQNCLSQTPKACWLALLHALLGYSTSVDEGLKDAVLNEE